MKALRANGIKIHAVTAEPGGDVAITKKLREFAGLELDFPVHSDPYLRLLPSGGILVHNAVHNSRNYAETQMMEYQGALVIADGAGRVQNWWSWKKLKAWREDLGVLKPQTANPTYDDPATNESVSLTAESIANGAPGSRDDATTYLVNVRPDPDDLVAAILERREFKLKAAIPATSYEETLARTFEADELKRSEFIPGYISEVAGGVRRAGGSVPTVAGVA